MHKKYYTIIAISTTILLSASFYYSKDSTPQEIKTIKKIQTEDNFQIKVINQNPTQNKMQESQTNSIKEEKEAISQNQEAKEKKHIRKLKKNTPIASTPLTQSRYSINIELKEELQKEEKTGVVNFIPLIFKINHENQSEELILTLEESYKNHIDNLEIKISDIVTKKTFNCESYFLQSIEPFTEYSINVDIENEANCYITEENKFKVPEIKIPQEVLDKLAKEISEQQLKQN